MHFRAVLDEAKTIKTIMQAVSKLSMEGKLVATQEGINIQIMDDSKVALAIISFPATAFYSYEFEPPTEVDTIELGLNVQNLYRFLNTAKTKDSVEFSFTPSERGAQHIVVELFRGLDVRSLRRIYRLPIITGVEIPQLDLSKFKPHVKVNFSPPAFLGDIFKQAKKIDDDVYLIADREKITIMAEGEIGEVFEFVCPYNDEDAIVDYEVAVPEGGEVRCMYSVDYILKIIPVAKVSDIVTVKFSERAPLVLEFRMAHGAKVLFVLAPKI